MRGATDWHKLKIEKRATPINIARVAKDLQKKYGKATLPAILDENVADAIVAKNTPKKKG